LNLTRTRENGAMYAVSTREALTNQLSDVQGGRGRVSGRMRPGAALGRRVVGGVSVEAAVGWR
jgi:hypothetical protein